MIESHFRKIAGELSISPKQVEAAVRLLDDGATVPFIARYRKEATGSLDEVAITAVRDRIGQLRALDDRREAILSSLAERDILTEELEERILAAETMTGLEDIYLPYRPKRRTRATIARERGLEPLAGLIFEQGGIDPLAEAAAFVDPGLGVETAGEALAGARDIIAEWVSENIDARELMRGFFAEKGVFRSRVIGGKEETGAKYRDYFEWEEAVKSAPSHRILAMRRGEREEVLSLRVVVPDDEAVALLGRLFITGDGPASQEVSEAVRDSFKRLLGPSMETEIRQEAKKQADGEAVTVFAENLRELLFAPPLGCKRVLAVDPGFRTGCKICCLDSQGKLLHHDTIFPHLSGAQRERAKDTVIDLCGRFGIDVIAVGNGTAGRETEAFLGSIGLPGGIAVVMVNESGASVYSASDAAREEFPDLDATVRGTVSIGRRLMDPLAELVKIDPKSIGVGQYQHDVDQGLLKSRLDDVVVSCVNSVGVEVNTASRQLLTYVSGLGPGLAGRIVEYREQHGPFGSRMELTGVPRLGAKAFEQAAGFLRIGDGANPLDASAVHPESYPIVERMARDIGCSVADLLKNDAARDSIDIRRYADGSVGIPTLTDIIGELAKPGRDPREEFEAFRFAEGVNTLEDVREGMRLPGIVTNVTAFGAFVDIGVHQDGLVHISQLADRFVKNPADVVRVNQKVTVTVLDVDLERRRISLSLRDSAAT
ncbi:MAG: RNA-binding transcriptional accessory protein [Candidatus Latescibacteria bacterium]|nr:RNA-binding transcriptional accessory protein [Candidatus Latescibacterota bacterium]